MEYVTILRKGSFTDFFKYGRLKIFYAVPMSGTLKAHADDRELFDRTVEGMNPYDYTSEYILIVFRTDNAIEQFPIEICIESVETVYALDETGRNALSLSFDHRIDIRVSPWETYFIEHHIDQLVEQSKQGARNLWRIFGFNDKDLRRCEEIIGTDIVREAISSLYRGKKPVGDLSPWVYLLRYERHDPYPKDMLGYFYDMIGVVMTWKSQGRADNFGVSETAAGRILKSNWEKISHPYPRVKNDQLSTLASSIKDEKIAAIAKDTTGVDFHLIAPFFLCLKDIYASDEDRMDQEKMGKQISSYGLEGKVATYLLGVTLGYDRTYDLLYDKIKLPFFKENSIPRERSGSATSIKPEQRVQRQSLGLEEGKEEAEAYWFRIIQSRKIMKMTPDTADTGWEPVQKFTKKNKTDIIERGLNFEEERRKQQEWNKGR